MNTAQRKLPYGYAPRYLRWLVVIVSLSVAWFYFWTINPVGRNRALVDDGLGYYNLLTRGFLKGQTSLDLAVDPALLAMKNPMDHAERAGRGLHDGAYYKGRYYIYFGVTPVVTAFVPIRILTGRFVDEKFVTAGFAVLGFWASAALFLSVRLRCFPSTPSWLVVVAVLMLGLATMVPALLRRPSVWEVPIAAAYACFMVTLLAVWRSLVGGWRGLIWLALGSLAMGLAVGARPTYMLASLVLLTPLAARLSGAGPVNWPRWIAATISPIFLAGVALAAYNYVRFEKVTEFGLSYQMNADGDNGTMQLFSPRFFAYNFQLYLLEPAGLSPFFPFITVINPPVAPAGPIGMIEDPYGLLPCMPWVAFAGVGLFFALWGGWTRALRIWFFSTFAAAVATTCLMFCFGGTCGRYMVDFTPSWMLLAGIGASASVTTVNKTVRWFAAITAAVFGIWSAGFGLFASFQHNGLLKIEYPDVYHKLAYTGNLPGFWLERLTGQIYGPVEMDVVFPRGAAGQVEPLVVTGRTFRSDYVFVHYLADDRVRFGFEHTSLGGAVGEPVAIVPGATQRLRIEMGSLYPPAAHPYFDAMPPGQARRRQRTVRVTMNGKVAFYRSAELFDAVARRPDVGTAAGRGAFKQPFSGKILGQRIVPAAVEAEVFGPVVITVTLPPFAGVRSEPLVSSGETGKGDVVYIRYLDARTVVFGYDHWGYGGFESDAVAVKPGEELVITVDYGALYAEGTAPRDRVVVRLNGRIVADRAAKFHPCTPDTVVVGANMIGASTAAAVFSGNIIKQQRTAP